MTDPDHLHKTGSYILQKLDIPITHYLEIALVIFIRRDFSLITSALFDERTSLLSDYSVSSM